MPKNKTDSQTQDALEKILVLLAATLVRDETTILEKVRLLGGLGLGTSEIAAACGTAESTVRARMAESKKVSRKRKN